MKRTKLALRAWISIASVLSFLGGWAVFSHSTKPAALFAGLNTSPALTAPAPIPSLDSLVASARLLKRAWQVYVAHIFLFAIYMAEIAYVASTFDNPLYREEMGIFEFLQQPGSGF